MTQVVFANRAFPFNGALERFQRRDPYMHLTVDHHKAELEDSEAWLLAFPT
jgi:hypothetical protein